MKVVIKNRERYQVIVEMCPSPPPEKRIVIPMRSVRENIEMLEEEFEFVKGKYSKSLVIRQQAN